MYCATTQVNQIVLGRQTFYMLQRNKQHRIHGLLDVSVQMQHSGVLTFLSPTSGESSEAAQKNIQFSNSSPPAGLLPARECIS